CDRKEHIIVLGRSSFDVLNLPINNVVTPPVTSDQIPKSNYYAINMQAMYLKLYNCFLGQIAVLFYLSAESVGIA
ncbi:hypothetical protein ACJX0J_025205, partial [Zea mays]